MIDLIKYWLGLLIANLNAGLSEDIFISELTSAPQSEKGYSIRLNTGEALDTESTDYLSIEVIIEFSFLLTNNSITNYDNAIKNIIYPLFKLCQSHNSVSNLPYKNVTYSTTMYILEVKERKMADLDSIDAQGYYKPKIVLTLNIKD